MKAPKSPGIVSPVLSSPSYVYVEWVGAARPGDKRSAHVLVTLRGRGLLLHLPRGLFIYLARKEKPLFLIRNVLLILLGSDIVHSCLGASEAMFPLKKKKIH